MSDTGSNGGLFAAESSALVPTTDLTYHIHSLREFFPGGSSGGSSSSGGTGGRGGVGGQEATMTGTGVSEGPVFDEGWERLSPRVSISVSTAYGTVYGIGYVDVCIVYLRFYHTCYTRLALLYCTYMYFVHACFCCVCM